MTLDTTPLLPDTLPTLPSKPKSRDSFKSERARRMYITRLKRHYDDLLKFRCACVSPATGDTSREILLHLCPDWDQQVADAWGRYEAARKAG